MKSVILKTVLPISLILAMTIPAVAQSNINDTIAENQNAHINPDNTDIVNHDNQMITTTTPGYLRVQGKIARIENNSDITRISIDTDNLGEIIYNVYDTTLIYSLDSTERVELSKFAVDQTVSIFYNDLTPQTMSLPPQINPEVIIIHDNLVGAYVKVDYFNEDSISSDGLLKLNTIDTSLIVDENNNMVRFDNAMNKNLIVFYNNETTSVPSQVPAVKIVVLSSEPTNNLHYTPEPLADTENTGEAMVEEQEEVQEVQVEDIVEIVISGLGNEVITMIDNTRYVQIEPVATQLGFMVSWDPATALVTLTKDNTVITLTPSHTEYSHNRALRYFNTAPFIQNDKTYVEHSIFSLMR